MKNTKKPNNILVFIVFLKTLVFIVRNSLKSSLTPTPKFQNHQPASPSIAKTSPSSPITSNLATPHPIPPATSQSNKTTHRIARRAGNNAYNTLYIIQNPSLASGRRARNVRGRRKQSRGYARASTSQQRLVAPTVGPIHPRAIKIAPPEKAAPPIYSRCREKAPDFIYLLKSAAQGFRRLRAILNLAGAGERDSMGRIERDLARARKIEREA